MITVVVKVIHLVFRFRFIQPEDTDAAVIIVLFHNVPDKLARFGVCRVISQRVATEIKPYPQSAFCPDEVTFLQHFMEVLTFVIHKGPNRHHQFDAQVLQFAHHGIRVGKLPFIKAPVALVGPVKEVRHDD